jgi:hypothetical protein
MLLALVVAVGLGIGSAAPARADGHLGLLFDGTPDFTLPNTAITRQITDASVNEGYVQIPFSAGALDTLLAGPTFNGPANLPDGRSVTVATAFTVERFFGNRISYDRLLFGLSPDGQRARCDFSALTREVTRQSLDGPVNATPSTDRSVSVTYVIGDELNAGAKIGFIRITPTAEMAGNWVCMYRETLIREVNNPSPTTYDVQRSQVVMTAEWINIGFPGALSDPGRVEEDEEDEEEAEVAAPEPEADDEAEEDEADDADADAAADEADETDAAADADAADADAEDTPADDADANDDGTSEAAAIVGSTEESTDDDATDDPALEASAAVGDDGDGRGLLIPVLLALVVVLLGGIVLVLARGRDRERPVESASEPVSEGPQG